MLAEMIADYSLDQFNHDKSTWLKTGNTNWFVHGNISKGDAKKLCVEVNGML